MLTLLALRGVAKAIRPAVKLLEENKDGKYDFNQLEKITTPIDIYNVSEDAKIALIADQIITTSIDESLYPYVNYVRDPYLK